MAKESEVTYLELVSSNLPSFKSSFLEITVMKMVVEMISLVVQLLTKNWNPIHDQKRKKSVTGIMTGQRMQK